MRSREIGLKDQTSLGAESFRIGIMLDLFLATGSLPVLVESLVMDGTNSLEKAFNTQAEIPSRPTKEGCFKCLRRSVTSSGLQSMSLKLSLGAEGGIVR